MTNIIRRTILKSAVAAPLAMALPPAASAAKRTKPAPPPPPPPTPTTPTRYDLASAKGREMLAIYAGAVRAMQALGPQDPMGWLWQWYTHFVNPTTTKANEITRIFGTSTSSLRTLADEMWNTCQSHAGQNANHFLPWHRMYVFYFERICAQLTGRPDFTLPYWDYTSTDPAKRGVVPVEFRMPNDPVFGSLYRAERTALANSGQPIHLNQPVDVMDIDDIMRRAEYSSAGGVMGFCRAVDSGIHGRMHVLIGNSLGMGSVPWAARDPIFWVHHSNIDRMWASWNSYGGSNPSGTTWEQNYFVLADAGGVRIRRMLGEFFGTNGIAYDVLVPRPAALQTAVIGANASTATMAAGGLLAAVTRHGGADRKDGQQGPVNDKRRAVIAGSLLAVAAATGVAMAAPREEVVARGRDAARLGGAEGASVELRPVPGARSTPVLGLDESQPGKRTYLVLRDLHTWKQPEVLFHVYLRPGNGAGKLDRSTYAGNINFFDAEFHDHGGGEKGDVLGSNFYSFDVTEILRAMRRGNGTAAGNSLRVTIVPAGSPTAGSEPMVATIALVRQ